MKMTTSIPTFSDPVSIALIGMIGTFLTALLGLFTAYLGRQNSKSIVATQADVSQVKAERKDTAIAQSAQLTQIHSLVNSNLTASKMGELASDEANLASLLEIVDLKQKQGIAPGVDATSAIEDMKTKITELRAELADRKQ